MIKIILVDDHELIRDGFGRLIQSQTDMELIAGVGSARELSVVLDLEIPDILILDITLPDKNGIELLKDLKSRYSGLPVLILSMHAEEHYALRCLRNGASGYITKGSSSKKLLTAIRKISSGGVYMSSEIAELLAISYQKSDSRHPHENLSDREFEILCEFGNGKSAKDIAESLGISVNTVRTYRQRIIDKMDLHSTAEIIQYTLDNHLLD